MSQNKLDIVLQIDGISHTERIVLLVLAQLATTDSKVCTVSTSKIANAARISKATVRRVLNRLLEKNLLMQFDREEGLNARQCRFEKSYYLLFLPEIKELGTLLQDLLNVLENTDLPLHHPSKVTINR